MSDIDALRRLDDDDDYGMDDDPGYDFDAPVPTQKRFLGMTAIERMFLSIFLFLNVLILGFALLLATNRIGF